MTREDAHGDGDAHEDEDEHEDAHEDEHEGLRANAGAAMLGGMSSHRGAPADPRSAPVATEVGGAEGGAAEAPPALRWDGATPPAMPVPDDTTVRCHACDAEITGEPGGHGLLVFPRGDDVIREEPPLCEPCALAIGVTALWGFAQDEEEG